MLSLLWTLSATLRDYLRLYLPTNRAVDWLRTPRGLRSAIPVAMTVTPAYLFCASVCSIAADRDGPGYLNALVLLFFWNAVKFAAVGAMTPLKSLRSLNPASTHRRDVDSAWGRPPAMYGVRGTW